MTGNRAILKMNGTAIGAASNIRTSRSYGTQRIHVLGQAEAAELVPGAVTYNLTASKFIVSGQELSKLGIVPTGTDFLKGIYFDLEVVDNSTPPKTIEHYTGCQIDSQNSSYSANQPSTEDVSIIALKKVGL